MNKTVIYDGLKKTILLNTSPLIVIAVSFCVAGIGLFGYFYYSDHLEQQPAKDENMSTKLTTQKINTVYKVTNNLIKNPTNLPSKMKIMGDYAYQKNYIFSYKDIFHSLWIPLLIIGSYILVQSDKGLASKMRV